MNLITLLSFVNQLGLRKFVRVSGKTRASRGNVQHRKNLQGRLQLQWNLSNKVLSRALQRE